MPCSSRPALRLARRSLGMGQLGGGRPMTSAKTVLVPLDGSVHATAAVPVARGLAELFHATLAVLHVSDDVLASAALVERMKLSSEDVRGLVVDQRSGAAAASHRARSRRAECGPDRHVPADPNGRQAAGIWQRGRSRSPRGAVPRRPRPPDSRPQTTGPCISCCSRMTGRRRAPQRSALRPTSHQWPQPELVVLHVATAGTERPTEPGTLVSPRYVDQPQHEWPAWAQEFLDRLRAVGRCNGWGRHSSRGRSRRGRLGYRRFRATER